MEQPFAVNSTTKVEFKSFEKQSSCRAARNERSLFKWNGHDCDVSMHDTIWDLLLSCDNVLKFDWYCKLSGEQK